MIEVKICGVKTKPVLEAALRGGADYIGFMFYPASQRNLSLTEAIDLRAVLAPPTKNVAVVVDADNDWLDAIMRAINPDWIQAHGGESPARIREIKARYRRPIVKAVAIATAEDIAQAMRYDAADMILFDTKSEQKGGSGETFNWDLLGSAATLPSHWMLAGGLNVHNIAQAVAKTRATRIDISSGVESAAGEKTPARVQEFLLQAKTL